MGLPRLYLIANLSLLDTFNANKAIPSTACHRISTCIGIYCNRLSVGNGSLGYSPDAEAFPFEFSTVAMYYCDDGYYLVGNRVRTCGGEGYTLDSGLWNGTESDCLGEGGQILLYLTCI